MTSAASDITILSSLPPSGDYGESEAGRSAIAFRDRISVQELGDRLAAFTHSLGSALGRVRSVGGDFELEEVEVHAVMSADGQLTILGSGLSSSVEGGLKLVFKRNRTAIPSAGA